MLSEPTGNQRRPKTPPRKQFGEIDGEGATAEPFGEGAPLWRARGWFGTIPLPDGDKHPPPTGTTGRGRPYPDDVQVQRWRRNRPTGNIGLHLGPVDGTDYETVGLDVDDYPDGDKQKTGGAQLAALEAELGALPDTWRSSARADRVSGIRFYLVPAGLAFRGKAAQHIDVIQHAHRYAVVWPSMHPDGGRYRLRTPGSDVPTVDIPRAADLPVLPDAWVDFLTNGRTRDDGVPIDLDSTDDSISQWARDTLPGRTAKPCDRMRRDVDKWLAEINADPSSHDKITGAHWCLLNNAAEGHAGWPAAVREVEKAWRADVARRGKRSLSDLRGEIGRSKTVALRKLKQKADDLAAEGLDYIGATCACNVGKYVDTGRVTRSLADVPRSKVEWLWRPWIPLGKVSILEGEPDVGKSVLTLAMSALVSTGQRFPQSIVDDAAVPQGKSAPAGVVLVGIEDDEGDTIVPRLEAARADRTRIHTMRQPVDSKGNPVPFVLPEGVDRLRRAIGEAQARFVVIDPITAYLSTKQVKAGDDPSTRQALMPLVELARETGCAILLVRHLNKAQGMSAKNRGSGTVAYGGLSRSVIVAGKIREPEPGGPTHAIALTKGNLSKDPVSTGYRLDSAPNDPDSPLVRFLGPIELSADQLVGADGAKTGDARKHAPTRDECEAVLRELLADGPMRADEAIAATRSAVGCSAKPVREAAKSIGVVKRRVYVDGKVDHWTWALPPTKTRIRKRQEDNRND
jgi:hypothetical protein